MKKRITALMLSFAWALGFSLTFGCQERPTEPKAKVARIQLFERTFKGIGFASFSDDGKTIYVGELSSVYAIDAKSGSTIWEHRTETPGPLVVLGDENSIFVFDSPTRVDVLHPESGKVVKQFNCPDEKYFGGLRNPPLVSEGNLSVLYSPSPGKLIKRLSLKSGESEVVFKLSDQLKPQFGDTRLPRIRLLALNKSDLYFVANKRMARLSLESLKVEVMDKTQRFGGNVFGRNTDNPGFTTISDSNELVTVNLGSEKPELLFKECGELTKYGFGQIFEDLQVIAFSNNAGKNRPASLLIRGFDGDLRQEIPFGSTSIVDVEYSAAAGRFLAYTQNGELCVWGIDDRTRKQWQRGREQDD